MPWLNPNIVYFAIVAFLILNLKGLPFVWHARVFGNIFDGWFISTSPKSPGQQFVPVISTSRSPLFECDFQMHKSNSSYITDHDIAKVKFQASLLRNIYDRVRKGGGSVPFPVLAGVVCSFKKQIRPYEKYETCTRVLCWDEKWIWMISHFVRPSRVNGHTPIVLGCCLSKIVFKTRGKTMPPAELWAAAGYLDVNNQAGAENAVKHSESFPDEGRKAWTAAAIEKERLRGLRSVELMYSLGAVDEMLKPEPL